MRVVCLRLLPYVSAGKFVLFLLFNFGHYLMNLFLEDLDLAFLYCCSLPTQENDDNFCFNQCPL